MSETYREWRDRTDREFLIRALQENGWNVAWTSVKLGLHRQTLLGKIHRLNIERPAAIERTFYGHRVMALRDGTIPKFEDYPGRKK